MMAHGALYGSNDTKSNTFTPFRVEKNKFESGIMFCDSCAGVLFIYWAKEMPLKSHEQMK